MLYLYSLHLNDIEYHDSNDFIIKPEQLDQFYTIRTFTFIIWVKMTISHQPEQDVQHNKNASRRQLDFIFFNFI